ncbi:MAG: hypothetical protein AAFX09_13010 [Pseudomonadota bacterium]
MNRFTITGAVCFISARLRLALCALLAAWAIKFAVAAAFPAPEIDPEAPGPTAVVRLPI